MNGIRKALSFGANLFSADNDRELSAALMDTLVVATGTILMWIAYIEIANVFGARYSHAFTTANFGSLAFHSLVALPLGMLAAVTVNRRTDGGEYARRPLVTALAVLAVITLSTSLNAFLAYGQLSIDALLRSFVTTGIVAVPAAVRFTAKSKPIYFGDDLGATTTKPLA